MPRPRQLVLALATPLAVAGLLFAAPALARPDGPSVEPRTPPSTTEPPPSSTTTSSSTTSSTVAPVATTVPPRPATVAVAASPAAAPPSPEALGAAALARLSYPVAALGYSVHFESARGGLLGKANCTTHVVTVYVRPNQSVEQLAFVTAFELAHAVDCSSMTDARRAEWAQLRGFPAGWTWFPSCTCTEDNFGSGDFSMVFAHWLTGQSPYGWRSRLAGPPANTSALVAYLRPATLGG